MSELTVWHNGNVWINKDERSDALAARDGHIVAHGSQAVTLIAEATHVIDLNGRTLAPGFGDGHSHPVFGGIETLFANVRGHNTLDELLGCCWREIVNDDVGASRESMCLS